MLVGEPINVFILPDAAKGFSVKQFNGLSIEAIGKMKLYNGEPEVVVDDASNITIVNGGD